ncbi:MAG: transposase [Verrucomicrobiota bacterium]
MKIKMQDVPGSARVSRAGDGVSPSRTFLDNENPVERSHEKSPSRRDNATSTRDACATQAAKPAIGARYSRRRLPHFEKPWAIYAVAISTKLRRCLSPAARTVVLNSLQYFHNKRYELFAACVMPDHVHFLFQPWPQGNDDAGNVVFWPLNELIHSIKSFSAHQINKIENRNGAVWEREQFDRYIRSDRDLEEKFQYILRNPWTAGVAGQNEDYSWLWTQDHGSHMESSSRRDSTTSTRDACATQSRSSLR